MLAVVILLMFLALIHSSAAGQENTPTPTLEPTHIPFGDAEVYERVSRQIVNNCLQYLTLVERWQPDFPAITPDYVFAVAAQESRCDHTAGQFDRVGSIGLMQVAPLSGRPTAGRLAQPSLNVYWGMKVLDSALRTSQGDMRLALAAYNCGFEGVKNDACGSKGGYAYADRVLHYWLPMVREALGMPQPTPTSRPKDTDQWLQDMGLLPTEQPTREVIPTPTPAPTERVIYNVVPDQEKGESPMNRRPISLFVIVVLLSLALMAFQVVDESRVEEIIAGIVAFALMLFGPRPLKALFDLLNLPGGPVRVLATYVVAGVVGLVALLVAGAFVAVEWNLETVMALAGALATAANMAYHRLKDLGRLAG